MTNNTFTLSIGKCSLSDTSFLMESLLLPWGEDDQVVATLASSEPCRPAEATSLGVWHRYLANSLSEGLVLDIGSYSGIYSLLACMSSSQISSLAFEPSSVTFGRLSRNIALNKLFSRIIPFHGAAWSKPMHTHLPHRYGPLSLNSGDGLAGGPDCDHEELVACIAPDALLADGPLPGAAGSKALASYRSLPIVAMKIDVEGAEMEVLRGSEQIIRQYSPLVIAEALDEKCRTELSDFFAGNGYSVDFIEEESNVIAYPASISRQISSADLTWTFSRKLTYIF